MTQLRRHSLLESCLNTASGFLVSYLAWPIVCRWVLHVPFHAGPGLEVIGVFTALSIARNYLWRRAFDRKLVGPWLTREQAEKLYLQQPTPEPERQLRFHRHRSPSMDCECIESDAYICAAMRYRHQLNRYWHPQICVCPCHGSLRPPKPPPERP